MYPQWFPIALARRKSSGCNREGLIDPEHLFHGQLAHVAQILRLKYLAAERSEDGAGGRYTALWCGE
ncbi:hypothetical protein BVI1335_1620001 [Burkholderia vietnamiensis]|nr:hypothetical protein BVI1335_1620001 [Burkholderia vietnamiensis]